MSKEIKAPTDLSKYAVKKTNPVASVLTFVFLIIWTLINLYPLFWMIIYSLKTDAEILGGNPLAFPEKAQWVNYVVAVQKIKFVSLFMNSIIVAVGTIAITILAALMATYALTRLKWRGAKLVNSTFMLGLTIPIHSALVPIFMSFTKMHLTNTYFALIIPYSAFALSLSILICSGFMVEIPKDLDEAAYIDGCGIWEIFFKIIVPLMKPALATIGIYTFLQCWNEYMLASLLCGSLPTLPVGIASFSGGHDTDYALIGAGLVVTTFPTLIVYAFLSNKIQESFIAGAVKG